MAVSLEGALGKIAIRTRSAPRPLLQVESKSDVSSSPVPASPLPSSLNRESDKLRGAALNRRQVLIALENVYEVVLQLEQSRRTQPALAAAAQAEQRAQDSQNSAGIPAHPVGTEARHALQQHEITYSELVDRIWKGMKVMEPLDVSNPHPFISLLSATKGKRLLPRALRHLNAQQTLTLLTLLVATFDTLDVVKDAPILDTNPNDPILTGGAAVIHTTHRRTRKQVESETETMLNVTIPLVMSTVGKSQLRIVTGMLGLLIERNDLIKLAETKVWRSHLHHDD